MDCITAGASIINLSSAIVRDRLIGESKLDEALNYAAQTGVIVVAAAGNDGLIGSSVITRHRWVIPVVACDMQGRPMSASNMGGSIGKRGLSAPGQDIATLGTNGQPFILSGTSAAAPFVTGAIALLWSEFPLADALQIKVAMTEAHTPRRGIMPPLLDASGVYEIMASAPKRKRAS